MTASTLHPLAAEWLERLRTAAAYLPPSERADLLSDIEAHLAESIPPDASEAEVRTALDRMGDPEEIVAEAAGPAAMGSRRGALEWAAIILLLLGGFLFLVGWFAGVALLWSSRAWTVKDKLIGTFVVPGGLALLFYGAFLGLTTSGSSCGSVDGRKPVCSDGSGGSTTGDIVFALVVIALVVLPIGTSVYLARRADRPQAVSS